jgi:hypothetical protein
LHNVCPARRSQDQVHSWPKSADAEPGRNWSIEHTVWAVTQPRSVTSLPETLDGCSLSEPTCVAPPRVRHARRVGLVDALDRSGPLPGGLFGHPLLHHGALE